MLSILRKVLYELDLKFAESKHKMLIDVRGC